MPFESIIVFSRSERRETGRIAVQRKENQTEEDVEDEVEEISPCQVCGSVDNESVSLMCQCCNNLYHSYCLRGASPPGDMEEEQRKYIPSGLWFCDTCAKFDNCYECMECSDPMGDPSDRLYGSVESMMQCHNCDGWIHNWCLPLTWREGRDKNDIIYCPPCEDQIMFRTANSVPASGTLENFSAYRRTDERSCDQRIEKGEEETFSLRRSKRKRMTPSERLAEAGVSENTFRRQVRNFQNARIKIKKEKNTEIAKNIAFMHGSYTIPKASSSRSASVQVSDTRITHIPKKNDRRSSYSKVEASSSAGSSLMNLDPVFNVETIPTKSLTRTPSKNSPVSPVSKSLIEESWKLFDNVKTKKQTLSKSKKSSNGQEVVYIDDDSDDCSLKLGVNRPLAFAQEDSSRFTNMKFNKMSSKALPYTYAGESGSVSTTVSHRGPPTATIRKANALPFTRVKSDNGSLPCSHESGNSRFIPPPPPPQRFSQSVASRKPRQEDTPPPPPPPRSSQSIFNRRPREGAPRPPPPPRETTRLSSPNLSRSFLKGKAGQDAPPPQISSGQSFVQEQKDCSQPYCSKSTDSKGAIMKGLDEEVFQLLNPIVKEYFRRGKISGSQYRHILSKAMKKVKEVHLAKGHDNFNVEKLRILIKDYVEKASKKV